MLPVLMLLFALLVQPVCVFYTICVMRHAAAETARVLVTTSDEAMARAFALRRLAAIPEASVFHVGGDADWRVSFGSSQEGRVGVRIAGHVRPLPFFGVVVGLMGRQDSRGVLLETSLSEKVRPSWLKGGYEDWVSMWQPTGEG